MRMNFLFESPMYVGLSGLFVIVISTVAWFNTANKYAAWSAGGATLLTLVMLMIENYVVTYREEIELRLDEVAEHLQNNRVEEVIAAIHPAAQNSIQSARSELPKYRFSEARVTTIRTIDVDSKIKRPRAVAEFNVFVALTVDGQSYRVPRFITLTLYRENDKWFVFDYSHSEPTTGMRNRSGDSRPL